MLIAYRQYVKTRCSKCNVALSSSELVMRVKELVFHVDCFTCHSCEERFSRGQKLVVVADTIYCTTHYQQLLASTSSASVSTASSADDDTSLSRQSYYNSTSSQARRARKRSGRQQTTDIQTLGTYRYFSDSVNN